MKIFKKVKKFFDVGVNLFVKDTIHGFFWLSPIVALIALIFWMYGKADKIAEFIFQIIGITPKNFPILWTIFAIILLVISSFIVGRTIQTRAGKLVKNLLEIILSKIPFYKPIKELISLFNSAREGNESLVVMIKGFSDSAYNTGLMYAVKESVFQNHYTVVLSQTPIPNGGYEFEVHADNIIVLGNITFNHYLAYLLAMGSKSLAEIAGVEPQPIHDYPTLTKWLRDS